MKKILTLVLFIVLLLNANTNSYALESYQGSASITIEDTVEWDRRVYVLKKYLDSHKSPLAQNSENFIAFAEQYNLDWRLVAAISGVESTFGKRIPANSFNAYGWANGAYAFTSWEDSIETVTSTLSTKYVDKGANTVSEIGKIYAPPSTTWAHNVEFFKNKIEPLPVEYSF